MKTQVCQGVQGFRRGLLVGLVVVACGVGAMGWAAIPEGPSPAPGPPSAAWTAALSLDPPAAKLGASPALVPSFGQLPLQFEANQGQTDAQVKFLARGRGYTMFLTPTEAVLVLRKNTRKALNVKREAEPITSHEPSATSDDLQTTSNERRAGRVQFRDKTVSSAT